jgi:small redox-active disulfide protein 2
VDKEGELEENDYRLVFVGHTQVGLSGLKEIFEEIKSQSGKAETDLKQMLVGRASKKNYIVPSLKQEYENALFREFKKFLGEEVEEKTSGFLEVAILGPGCYTCNKLEQDVMAILSETGIQASLNHITDPGLIAQYGVLALPALIINGTLKSKGTIPSKSMIKKWLEEEEKG